MDFDAGLLIFLFIFFVLPLIQRVLGGKKVPPADGQPGPHGRGVPPRQPQNRVPLPDGSRIGTPERSADDEPARAQAERAADLIPDDLWQILTGERRSPAPVQRQRAPVPEVEEGAGWGTDVEEVWEPEETAARVPEPYEAEPSYQESGPYEAPWHRQDEETAPPPPITREPEPTTRTESMAAPAPAPPADAYAIAPARSPLRQWLPHEQRHRLPRSFGTRAELKRAFVLREVLGPPKALE